ncbi:MAG: hypothetical protein ACTSWP_07835 [Candidatus Freyarchaeota archaeon]|nr:hypothetical protein [Candidatus Freyrarchaeum guaymaensis]
MDFVFSYFPHGGTFALKAEAAKRIPRKNPPINLLSKFGCGFVDEIPCDYRDALALASFSEGKRI